MYCVKINCFKFVFLLPGNGKDYENKFLQKKKYTEISATLPTPQKASILKTTVYRHCVPCSTSITDTAKEQGNLYPKKFCPLWERNRLQIFPQNVTLLIVTLSGSVRISKQGT